MAQRSFLTLIVYAPALASGDGRTLAAVRGLEQAFPRVRMEWKISEEGKPIALPQRDAWLAEAATHGKFPMLCNGDESYPVTIAGLERPARLSPAGQSQLEVYVKLPQDEAAITAAVGVLECVAEGTRAFWGRVLPEGVAVTMAEQIRHTRDGPHVPPLGLPELKQFQDIRSPAIPHHLGWLNYWSDETSRAMQFPDPARDVDLLPGARRTVTNGWVVRLTERPLDLGIPGHLEALLRAYERFPWIGGRAPLR